MPVRPTRLPPPRSAIFLRRSNRTAHTQLRPRRVRRPKQRPRAPRAESLAFVADLQDDPEVEVVWVDEALHRTSLALLQTRLDKAWSLCDGVSILLMQQRGTREALTTDHHFEQAGFQRLLP